MRQSALSRTPHPLIVDTLCPIRMPHSKPIVTSPVRSNALFSHLARELATHDIDFPPTSKNTRRWAFRKRDVRSDASIFTIDAIPLLSSETLAAFGPICSVRQGTTSTLTFKTVMHASAIRLTDCPCLLTCLVIHHSTLLKKRTSDTEGFGIHD